MTYEQIKWCKEHRANMAKDLDLLVRGRARDFKKLDDKVVDVTHELIETYRREIRLIDMLISEAKG